MEACATAPYWGRELNGLGIVKLVPLSTWSRESSKADAADAEAICEAVTRPTVAFVPIKSVEQQAALMLHRSRDLLDINGPCCQTRSALISPSSASVAPRASAASASSPHCLSGEAQPRSRPSAAGAWDAHRSAPGCGRACRTARSPNRRPPPTRPDNWPAGLDPRRRADHPSALVTSVTEAHQFEFAGQSAAWLGL